MLNLEEGISDHALLPSANIFHNLSGLVASPANLQLMPIIAIGSLAQLPFAVLILEDTLKQRGTSIAFFLVRDEYSSPFYVLLLQWNCIMVSLMDYTPEKKGIY